MGRLLLICFCSLFFLAGCSDASIRIGFLAPLTGKTADIGVTGRHSLQLAIEEINAQGGIAGKQLEFVVENSIGTPEETLAAARRLAQKDVAVIIGPFLSQKAIQIRPFIKSYDGAIVSPTVATEELTGQKDNFFRLIQTTKIRAQMLANYIVDKRSIKTAMLFGDADNTAYVNSFNNAFADQLAKKGGSVTDKILLPLSKERDWSPVIASLKEKPADSILVTTSANHMASLALELKQHKISVQIMGPNWPFHKQLLLAGGRDVEGIIFASSYNPASKTADLLSFLSKIRKRFGESGDSFAAIYTYESAQLVFSLLQKAKGDPKKLLKLLNQSPSTQGLYSEISLDPFGDVKRENFMMTIKNGAFVPLADAN